MPIGYNQPFPVEFPHVFVTLVLQAFTRFLKIVSIIFYSRNFRYLRKGSHKILRTAALGVMLEQDGRRDVHATFTCCLWKVDIERFSEE